MNENEIIFVEADSYISDIIREIKDNIDELNIKLKDNNSNIRYNMCFKLINDQFGDDVLYYELRKGKINEKGDIETITDLRSDSIKCQNCQEFSMEVEKLKEIIFITLDSTK